MTESQNDRMGGFGRDLWRWCSPTPCQGSVTWSRWHRNIHRWLVNVSREGHSWEQPVPMLCHSQCKVVLPHLRWNLLCFILWQLLCRSAPLRWACHHPLGCIYLHSWNSLSVFSSPACTGPAPAVSPHRRDVPEASSSLWLRWTLCSISLSPLHWGAQNWAQ